MDKRFGFRDLIYVLLFLVLIVSVWLAMKQFDRQYEVIRSINDKLDAQTRDLQAFNRYSEWIFNHEHTRDDEIEWLRQQGPWCPSLLEYLERHHNQYDVLIFFTYLYAPTVLGLRIAPQKSILVPTAHDEPAIHLDIYK